MKILITGAGGFCGTHLCRYLAGEGGKVYQISHQGPEAPGRFRVEDVTDWKCIAGVIDAVMPDYVFHLAGVVRATDPSLFYRVNSQYAIALLHAMERKGREDCPILLVGTAAEYGLISETQLPIAEDLSPRPYNHYGVSKLTQTLAGLVMARKHRPLVVVRPFNVIGPGMPEHLVVQSMAVQVAEIRQGKRPPLLHAGNLKTMRDFLGIQEVVRIYWQLIRNPAAYGEIINICSGRATPIREILDTLLDIAGCSVEIRTDPSRLKEVDIPIHFGSVEKLNGILGRRPTLDLQNLLRGILNSLENG
jgi:nucleoside-diphosphate-sugar epimerase